MPIMFTDDHVCEKCGKTFEWNYFELIRQNIDSSQFKVETIPCGKILAHSCQKKSNDIYDVEVNCPYCDFDNHFTLLVK